MAATLGDPHTLVGYPISQHMPVRTHHVFTYAPVGDERDFSATIGVQGDGIHIIDVSQRWVHEGRPRLTCFPA